MDIIGNMIKRKILLMEDDIDLGETIKELLETKNYKVSLVTNGIEASEISYREKFDIYVFDINVPEFNGLELLKALRHANDTTATIFISAMVDINTITKAFEIGADDYIKKPFFPEELLVRIEAKFNKQEQPIYYNDLVFIPKREELFKDGKELYLSRMQMLLFKIFIYNINKKITKEDIMDTIGIRSDSALRVAITKLKKSTNLSIHNIHGVGYKLETR